MHIIDIIFYWARTVPHRSAIIQNDQVISFRGLAEAIESIGERIDRLNFSKRQPVAVSLSNPAFMLASIFALLRGGYNVSPVNARLYSILADAGIRNMIYDGQDAGPQHGRNVRFDLSWLPGSQQPTATRTYPKRSTDNPSLIFFTSGSTGSPKAVVQTSEALDQRLRYSGYVSEIHRKVLIMPGLTSTFGLSRAFEVLDAGKTACFAPDGMAALRLINLFGVEVIVASTAQALGLADFHLSNPGHRIDTLKEVFVGGAKVTEEGIARIRGSLCRNVIHMYGSTEVGSVGRTAFNEFADSPCLIAPPWVEIEIVDEAGRQLPAGAEGLIRVRTPQLIETVKTAGPDELRSVRDGWFCPGDIGSLSGDGVLSLVGRSSDVINRGGLKISGARLEEVLKEMPEIRDAAACGVFGSSGLEEIWIGVVPNGSIDIEQIKARLREHKDIRIAPDEVIELDEVPRGELGKVQTSRLKELLLGRKTAAKP